MTHSGGKPHTNVGDRGQRYEIRTVGYPRADECPFGWSDDLDGAELMMSAALSAPGCRWAAIVDRQTGLQIIQRFGGILR
jgi:hypothetical protein